MSKKPSTNYCQIQELLKLSHSQNTADQQKAAIDLSKVVEGGTNTFSSSLPFSPIAHALCHSLTSSNRTVATYSARALKILMLDNGLRSQSVVAGIPSVVYSTILQWEDEILCLRELLGTLQTLTWDKQCVKGVLQTDIIPNLIDYLQVSL